MFPCCLIFCYIPEQLGVSRLPANMCQLVKDQIFVLAGFHWMLQRLRCWLIQQQRLPPLIFFSHLPVCHNLFIHLWELTPPSCIGTLHRQGRCSADMLDNSFSSFSQSLLIALKGPQKFFLLCVEICAWLLEYRLKSLDLDLSLSSFEIHSPVYWWSCMKWEQPVGLLLLDAKENVDTKTQTVLLVTNRTDTPQVSKSHE